MSELVEATGESAQALSETLMAADARTEEALRSAPRFGLVIGGFVVGAGLGGAAGYFFCKRQLETKYYKMATDEIAEMQQHYNEKVIALDSTNKTKLEDLVREKGYSVESSEPPMAVTPPAAVVEAAQEGDDEEDEEAEMAEEEIEFVEPVQPEPEVRNVFRDTPQAENGWDYHKERSRRSPLRPYVIHIDEREERDAYDGVTFTYYEADDVLCNERDEAVSAEDRERLVGETNLEKFGHGSGDPSVVYIRNDQLEMIFEVVQSPNSYAEEVHGFQHSDTDYRRRERLAFDDER